MFNIFGRNKNKQPTDTNPWELPCELKGHKCEIEGSCQIVKNREHTLDVLCGLEAPDPVYQLRQNIEFNLRIITAMNQARERAKATCDIKRDKLNREFIKESESI